MERTTVLPEFYRPVLSEKDENALVHGTAPTYFEYLKDKRMNDPTIPKDIPSELRQTWPFSDLGEWSLARWLLTSGISKGSIDQFLQLPWVIILFDSHLCCANCC
jgi:hypothetical protein